MKKHQSGEEIRLEKQDMLTRVLFVIYLLALTWLILFKLQFSVPEMNGRQIINLIPLAGSFDDNGVIQFSEIRLNVLAFIPLGIYLGMLQAQWSFVKKLLAIVGLALAFEIIQFIFVIGRADITDVLGNTLGGIVGIGIYTWLTKLLKGRANRLITLFAATSTILALLLVALLLISHRWVRIQ